MTAAFQKTSSSERGASGSLPGPYDEMCGILGGLPRPRTVRMSHRGKLMASLLLAALLASLGMYAVAGVAMRRTAGNSYSGPSQFPVFALSFAFIAVFVFVMLHMIASQKRLLAEGEFAVGLVTKQWAARNGPSIRYEFSSPMGERFWGISADGSRQLSVGMNVPIFYDPQNPKKKLALCASFHEVVLP